MTLFHLLLGRNISLFPRGLYCIASVGKRSFSILFTYWIQFCRKFLISSTILSWLSLFLISTFLWLPHLVKPINVLWRRICAASGCSCFLLCSSSTVPFIPHLKVPFLYYLPIYAYVFTVVSLRFPHSHPVCTSALPHTCHMLRPSHSYWFCSI